MKILLVKMSSMGDIFHMYPAITDLRRQLPDAEIHWVVEEGFAEIAAWHPAVARVIPFGMRRWMKNRNLASVKEFFAWVRLLRKTKYDLVLDAQGILKSVVVAKSARGRELHGYDRGSVRNKSSSRFYKYKHSIPTGRHAVEQLRELFGTVFDYSLSEEFSFGIAHHFRHIEKNARQMVFIPGTTWLSKMWSVEHWQRLVGLALGEGYNVELIWGSEAERELADSIIAAHPLATRASERLDIAAVAEKLVGAAGVVGMDTGFSHLSGALETPTVALYGPTSPQKLGLIGPHTRNLQMESPLPCVPCHKRTCKLLPEGSRETPPCLQSLAPQKVWRELLAAMPELQGG